MSSIFVKEYCVKTISLHTASLPILILVPQAVTTPICLCIAIGRFKHSKGNMQDGKDQRSSEVVQRI
ncbi:MAG: hypothetical protein FKGGLIKP_00125 [Sodalis sp. Fse]|nr:MAG: hypothetical protein CMIDDMOC_00560 [Sodalis sp. Fle]UVK77531.1 MAG: hypothetical protein FKGGLIKP_00125 [Sodalis sp. Fse]UVK78934.1 MAG: hypothetical protein IGNPGNKH_00404 [Sodalis sp. Ffu]